MRVEQINGVEICARPDPLPKEISDVAMRAGVALESQMMKEGRANEHAQMKRHGLYARAPTASARGKRVRRT